MNELFDLTGYTAMVTGANRGLGLQISEAVAKAGAHVVMAVRDPVGSAAAVDAVRLQAAGQALTCSQPP